MPVGSHFPGDGDMQGGPCGGQVWDRGQSLEAVESVPGV